MVNLLMQFLITFEIGSLKDILIIIGQLVAIFSLWFWHREHIGRKKIDIAQNALALFYEARDAIKFIRNPAGFTNETSSIEKRADEDVSSYEARKRASIVFVSVDSSF